MIWSANGQTEPEHQRAPTRDESRDANSRKQGDLKLAGILLRCIYIRVVDRVQCRHLYNAPPPAMRGDSFQESTSLLPHPFSCRNQLSQGLMGRRQRTLFTSASCCLTTMASASTENVPFFKKKKGTRPATARRRSASPDHTSSIPGSSTLKSTVVLPNKKTASNLLSAGTKRTTSQRDELDESVKDGPDVKWTAEGSHVNQALDILAGDEAEELLAKRRRKERLDAGEVDEPAPDDGQYHGKSAYRTHIKRTTETPKAMRVGPQRSANTIRTVTIVDYQPDVCKDYKGTYPRDDSWSSGALIFVSNASV